MSSQPKNRESRLASVAFIHLPRLFEQEPARSFDAIQELHLQLKDLGFPKGVVLLSAAAGAIVVARDGVLRGPKSAIHHYFQDLFTACQGLPLRIGLTHGVVEFFSDVEGGTYIGEPLNVAARLATAPENHGLPYEMGYLEFRKPSVDRDPFRPGAGGAIRVKGKGHDRPFVCFEAVRKPPLPKDFSQFALYGHQVQSESPAFIVAADLPRFSSGASALLSQRFRAFVDAALRLLAETRIKKPQPRALPWAGMGQAVGLPIRNLAPRVARNWSTNTKSSSKT